MVTLYKHKYIILLLPFAVKSLTGNVELTNRLGHGVSYKRTLEIDTAFALEKMAIHSLIGVAIPEEIHQHVSVSLVFDNIDRQEESKLSWDKSQSKCNSCSRNNHQIQTGRAKKLHQKNPPTMSGDLFYGSKKTGDANQLRCLLFCAK